MEKLRVGVLGGTGMVGQRFIQILENHPWFEVAEIAASPRSAGHTYGEAVDGRWKLDGEVPENVKNIVIRDINDVKAVADNVDFVLSAVNMSKDEIKKIEEEYAKTETPVVSNNSAHRWTPDVPMIIPEINPEHTAVIEYQKKRLGTQRGFIAVKPNCSRAGKTFKDWPEMNGNVIPFISGEEEKSEREPLRIFGHIENGQIVPAESPLITCQCIRIPVLYGHTAAAFVRFKQDPTKEELIEKLRAFSGVPQELKLPSAPEHFIQYMEEDDRPQVMKDVNYEEGMGVSIGRLRKDTMFDWKFVGLSHNTLRGAAGGAVECAELLTAQNYIQHK